MKLIEKVSKMKRFPNGYYYQWYLYFLNLIDGHEFQFWLQLVLADDPFLNGIGYCFFFIYKF